MNISAAELKRTLRLLSPVRSDTCQIGEHGVSSSDPDVWVIVDSPLSGLGSTFTINGKKLGQIVNRMSGQIEITREDKLLNLRSAKAKIQLEIQNVRTPKFPEIPETVFSLGLPNLKKALSVAHAVASTNKSSNFGGVVQFQSKPTAMEPSPLGYWVVGTDGAVLTLVENLEPVPEFKTTLNLEGSSLVQLMDGPTVEFGIAPSVLYFKSNGVTVFASKRDETDPKKQYPNFDPLLAGQPKLKFGFKTEDWWGALRTIEPLIDESVDQGTISLHFENNVVQYKNIGIGSTAQDEAPYEQIVPDAIFEPVQVTNLRLKAKFLSGFFSKAGESGTIGLTDTKTAVRLESGNILMLTQPCITERKK